MEGNTARRLGIEVLALASVTLVGALSALLPNKQPPLALAAFVLVLVLGDAALSLWVAFRFWRIAVGRPASGLFRFGFLLAILLPVLLWGLNATASNVLLMTPGVSTATALDAPYFVLHSWPVVTLSAFLPALLVVLGLVWSGWVSRWIACVGVAWVVLAAVGSAVKGLTDIPVSLVWTTGPDVVRAGFLLALGVALLLRARKADAAAASPS